VDDIVEPGDLWPGRSLRRIQGDQLQGHGNHKSRSPQPGRPTGSGPHNPTGRTVGGV
jgi:hypothetical protein